MNRPCGRVVVDSADKSSRTNLERLPVQWWRVCDEFMSGHSSQLATDGGLKTPNNNSSYFFDIKIPCEQTGLLSEFQKLGFQVVDVNVTLETNRSMKASQQTERCEDFAIESWDIETSVDTDSKNVAQHPVVQAVKQIAFDSFRFSRFHLDPNIDLTTANQIKAEWVGNCLTGERRSRVWIARKGSEIAGFLTAVEIDQDSQFSTAVLDLIAVSESFHGMGIGRGLSQAFIDAYHKQAQTLRVGTQVANIPALRLYESLGFRSAASSYVLHGHFGSYQPRS